MDRPNVEVNKNMRILAITHTNHQKSVKIKSWQCYRHRLASGGSFTRMWWEFEKNSGATGQINIVKWEADAAGPAQEFSLYSFCAQQTKTCFTRGFHVWRYGALGHYLNHNNLWVQCHNVKYVKSWHFTEIFYHRFFSICWSGVFVP